jgi:hypothetical protein
MVRFRSIADGVIDRRRLISDVRMECSGVGRSPELLELMGYVRSQGTCCKQSLKRGLRLVPCATEAPLHHAFGFQVQNRLEEVVVDPHLVIELV